MNQCQPIRYPSVVPLPTEIHLFVGRKLKKEGKKLIKNAFYVVKKKRQNKINKKISQCITEKDTDGDLVHSCH